MFDHVLGTKPNKIAIVGCRPSMQDFVSIRASIQSKDFKVDEVWGINAGGAALNVDLSFIMDDIALMKAIDHNVYEHVKSPVITSVPRREGDTAFPLAEVLNIPGARDYLNHTAAYALVYALLIGVKEICVFGCDYVSQSQPYAAGGRDDRPARYMACMAFWSGVAAARGVNVIVTPNSPLLDADAEAKDKFYGYVVPPVVKREGEDNG